MRARPLLTASFHSGRRAFAPDSPRLQRLAKSCRSCPSFRSVASQRRPVRDGKRWLILKEAAVWGDDPKHAFSVAEPEKVRSKRGLRRLESKIEPALTIAGPAAVAWKMRLAERWAAGARQPESPGEVRAIVAVAHGAGLGLPTDEHLRAEEICRECRAPRPPCNASS